MFCEPDGQHAGICRSPMPGGGIRGWFCIGFLLNKCPTGVPGKAIQEVGQRELLPGNSQVPRAKTCKVGTVVVVGKSELNHCRFPPPR